MVCPVSKEQGMAEASGPQWCARYPASTSLDDLLPDFADKVRAFLSQLTKAGATVTIADTYRPPQRAYLPLDGPASARGGVAPPAGAVLLEADDISSASGLVPGALEATLSGQAPKSPTGSEDR